MQNRGGNMYLEITDMWRRTAASFVFVWVGLCTVGLAHLYSHTCSLSLHSLSHSLLYIDCCLLSHMVYKELDVLFLPKIGLCVSFSVPPMDYPIGLQNIQPPQLIVPVLQKLHLAIVSTWHLLLSLVFVS